VDVKIFGLEEFQEFTLLVAHAIVPGV
jgi:hypothetical protein